MVKVVAIQSFDHGGARRRGQEFTVSESVAEKLEKAGLVAIKGSASDPSSAAGAKRSASPAAQASARTTSSKSKAGGKGRKAAESSSPTQASE